MVKIVVLRLGHRIARDIRVTTHCCLVARVFGAQEIVISGENDTKITETIQGVNERFGKGISVKFTNNWKKEISERKKKGFTTVHLTMYGEKLKDCIKALKNKKKLLIIVGAKKMPKEVFELADFNTSISSQPHSEIAALAVFLHEFFSGKELEKKFPKAKIKIIPQKKGKKTKVCFKSE